MTIVSNFLYELAEKRARETDAELDRRDASCFRWMWQWLLMNQSKKALQEELSRLAKNAEEQYWTARVILEMAWKAEALEKLLKNK